VAVPVLRYSFGIINWHREEIRKLERKTRKVLTAYGQHNPRADTDRLYVPRIGGGQGLTQMEEAYITETTKLVEYREGFVDLLLQVGRLHQHKQIHCCCAQHVSPKEHERKIGKEKGCVDNFRAV
jgi:hypothetical protein